MARAGAWLKMLRWSAATTVLVAIVLSSVPAAAGAVELTIPAGWVATLSEAHFGGSSNCPQDPDEYGYQLNLGANVLLAARPPYACYEDVPTTSLGPFASATPLRIWLQDADGPFTFYSDEKHALVSGSNPYTVSLDDSKEGSCGTKCKRIPEGPGDGNFNVTVLMYQSPPVVTTGSASEVTTTAAVMNALVNPYGAPVYECEFEYGTTESYGSTAACSPTPGTGETAVSASLTGLLTNTTYHFRLSATDEAGTATSRDGTFTTLASIVSATTKEETKPAEAREGALTAIASEGTGTVSVGTYGEDIGGPSLAKSSGKYFDVYHATTGTFKKIEITDCELAGGHSIWWDNPAGTWEAILEPPASYSAGSPACISMTLTESTKPSVAQLTGTRYGTRYGEPPGSLAFGKCEPMKHGYYAEGNCVQPDLKGGVPKGKYEWHANPVPTELLPNPFTCFAQKHGYYSESACATEDVKKGSPKGKYERSKDGFQGSGGVAALEIEGVGRLECLSSTSTGHLTSERDGTDTITLEGCKLGANECASPGASPGTIVSETLEISIEDEGEAVVTEAFGAPIMSFACGSEQYTLAGGIRGLTTGVIDTMSTTSETAFGPSGPEQELQTTSAGTKHRTELTTSYKLTTEQLMEINSNPNGAG